MSWCLSSSYINFGLQLPEEEHPCPSNPGYPLDLQLYLCKLKQPAKPLTSGRLIIKQLFVAVRLNNKGSIGCTKYRQKVWYGTTVVTELIQSLI